MKRSLCIMLLAVLCLCVGCGAASEGNTAQLHSSTTEAQADSVEPEIIEADWHSGPTSTKTALSPVPTTTLIKVESAKQPKEMYDVHLHNDDCRTATTANISDLSGLQLRLVNAQWQGEQASLTVEWRNDTVFDISFGESFDMREWDDRQWKSCTLTDVCWRSVAYRVPAGGTTRHTYRLTVGGIATDSDASFLPLFDLKSGHTYLLTADCFTSDGRIHTASLELTVP